MEDRQLDLVDPETGGSGQVSSQSAEGQAESSRNGFSM